MVNRNLCLLAFLSFFWMMQLTGCHSVNPSHLTTFHLKQTFPQSPGAGPTFDDSIIASPLIDSSQGRPVVIVPVSNGEITGLDSLTGAIEWKIRVPTPLNQQAQLVSTPLVLNNKLIVLYQCLENGIRTSHRLAVIDLVQKNLDPTFPVLVLSAEKPSADGHSTVKFNPPTAFSHAALKHGVKPGQQWGTVYAAFGNSGDTQPFHGWLFEIDLDAWRSKGPRDAISSVLLTTPESDCPVKTEYGTQEMICGGGIWTPHGPQLYPKGNDYELFVPVGNGQVDISRQDYANAILRLHPGLTFDAGCDPNQCRGFNPSQPDENCLSSCKNLFIPRLSPTDKPLKPANRECDNKTFWECLAWLDFDLGASSPLKVDLDKGTSVLIQPGKEGAVYLVDAENLGTQYDRLQISELCGTPHDQCKASWMGMIVTHPALAEVNHEPVVLVPTFMPDKTHPAGVVALKIVMEKGKPKLHKFWQFPNPSNNQATQLFRSHPSLPVISKVDNEAVVWIVSIGEHGTLYGIRVRDGQPLFEQRLLGTGRQLSFPLIYNDTIYLPSSLPSTGKTFIEAYQIKRQE